MDLIEKTENPYRHPWELSRCKHMLSFFQKEPPGMVYADIGSGDKFFAQKLARITNGKVIAVDKGYLSCGKDENGIEHINDLQLLKDSGVDYIIMMDVLEHIEIESEFIRLVLQKLKPGGKLLITVPAMQFLYSSHDKFLKHYRRYDKTTLVKLLNSNGLIIIKCHYFYLTLFFLRLAELFIGKFISNNKKERHGIGHWKYPENHWTTKTITLILGLDFMFSKLISGFNISLPGLSIFALCTKGKTVNA